MTWRAFSSQLAILAPSALLGVLAEGLASASRAGSLVEAGRTLVWTLGLWAPPTALIATLFAWLLAALVEGASMRAVLREQWSEPPRRDALLTCLFVAPALLVWVFVVARAAQRFHNVELAAALVAGLTLVGGLLLSALGLLGFRALVRGRAHGKALGWLPWAAILSLLLLVGWVAYACRSGLAQLDARLVAAPGGLGLGLVLLDGADGLRRGRRVVLAMSAALGCAAWLFFLLGGPRATGGLATRGVWSPRLITGIQRLTDFDRDGYSSLLGGGDCAPFDAAINPGAPEIIGDGIDNNCIGGDAGKLAEPRRPSWGQSAHLQPQNLNVVIVTIETLRHDHASFSSSRRDTTPVLRGLARESLVFERMYSAAPHTRLALASLFSSYAPSEIEWLPQDPVKRMRHLGPRTPWLPELLRARGYETIAVLTDFSAFTSREDAGFDRGFEHYDISTKLDYRGGTMWGFPAAEQVGKALAYLASARRPFFLWLHLFEPHYRYEQPADAPVFGTDEQARYDAEIWHVDHQIGRLLDGLHQLGVWDSTLLFVSGDHGEAFGEHRDRWHGTNLFDPQLRPAALLRVPGIVPKRVDASVTFTDVAPTLARLLGDRQSFEQMHGRSLAPLMHHGSLPDDAEGFVSESFAVEDGRLYQAALVAFPLKLIYVEEGRQFSLYDLAADPGEQQPIDPTSDVRGTPLLRQLIGYLERARPGSLSSPSAASRR